MKGEKWRKGHSFPEQVETHRAPSSGSLPPDGYARWTSRERPLQSRRFVSSPPSWCIQMMERSGYSGVISPSLIPTAKKIVVPQHNPKKVTQLGRFGGRPYPNFRSYQRGKCGKHRRGLLAHPYPIRPVRGSRSCGGTHCAGPGCGCSSAAGSTWCKQATPGYQGHSRTGHGLELPLAGPPRERHSPAQACSAAPPSPSSEAAARG